MRVDHLVEMERAARRLCAADSGEELVRDLAQRAWAQDRDRAAG